MLRIKHAFILLLVTLVLSLSTPTAGASPQMRASAIGTWTGESICFGKRAACKNEEVVYRIEEIPGKPDSVTLLADKIIDGKREPMGRMEFQYDQAKATLSCEFRIGNTHGIITLNLTGDIIEGTLLVLPAKTEGRRIKVKRTREELVPPAPPRELYGR